MNSRERVIRTLDHQEGDRVPIDFGGHVSTSIEFGAYVRLKKHFGYEMTKDELSLRPEQLQWGMPFVDERILRRFHADFRTVSFGAPHSPKSTEDVSEDQWGVKWRKSGIHYWIVDHPLKNVESVSQIRDHKWPDRFVTTGVRKQAKQFEDEGWAVMGGGGGIFEPAYWVRGMEQLFIDMYRRPEFVEALFDEILAVQTEYFKQMLDEVGDVLLVVQTADDLGSQEGLIMSPALYRKYLKPRHKKIFDLIHKRSSAKTFIHSCGSVEALLSDLIEIGLDVLNPVQPRAVNMNPRMLKEKYGRKLTFHGGIDSQRVLPYGTAEEVRNEVRETIKAFAPQGGYVLAPSQALQPEVPLENILAMFDAALRYGTYPL